ncbi:MAG TPA: single-stranded-DNA-specific exonuclease RecJ [Anaerolineales bacterium]|nr:single-stranded-DNA-specific exonuclease RecJ [Anaerolineales bacterium]
MTRWLDPQPVDIPASFADLHLPALIARTLVRRGISQPDRARAFLHPDAIVPVPFPGMEKAVECIVLAMRSHDPICVWGDFDADGQTSTALLVQALQAAGANVTYYIPIRGKESHGLHLGSLKSIIDHGAKLIITCDTGITAYEAIEYANSRGVQVIVTDHHDLGETLPGAKAIINPKLLAAGHPLADLAGVGVAYKLAEALLANQELGIGSPSGSQISIRDSLLDLVALGLIADVALLRGETRSLAQKGIQRFRNTQRLGLKTMAELAGANLETLNEETIGFTFAPRLNALGRLGDANPAVELLLTQDPLRARILAAQIEGLNAQRRLLTSQVHQAAESQIRENPSLLTEPAIVLSHGSWPGGVVGIVASELVGRYHKPALLLTQSEDGLWRGSARSIEGLNITKAIAANRDLLISFGGHPMAAGLSLRADQLTAFKRGLGRAIEEQLGPGISEEPALQIDAWLAADEVNYPLAESLESLAPFGAGNPQLILATRNMTLKSVKEIGKTREHRRLVVVDENGAERDLFWWNGAGEEVPEIETKIDVAYSLRASTYRGQRQLMLQLEEFHVLEEKPLEIRKLQLEIRDWRLENGKFHELPPGVLIWAEGSEGSKGRSRLDLHPADEFAIYTSPPSPAELRAVLEMVRPRTIYLFAVPPVSEKTDEFLSRLAGLAKFVINQRGGKANLGELAAATAEREATIRTGLEWLGAGGHLKVGAENGELNLAAGDGIAHPYLQREFYVAVNGLRQETSAYRNFFSHAEAESLFKF